MVSTAALALAVVTDGARATRIANMVSAEFSSNDANAKQVAGMIRAALIVRQHHHHAGVCLASQEHIVARPYSALHGRNIEGFDVITALYRAAANGAFRVLIFGELNRLHGWYITKALRFCNRKVKVFFGTQPDLFAEVLA